MPTDLIAKETAATKTAVPESLTLVKKGEIMFCPNCGTQNPDTSKFCSQCGRALPSLPASPIVRQPPPKPVYNQPARVGPLMSPTTLAGLAGMIGGALVVFGWFLPWSSVRLGNGIQIVGLLFAGGAAGGAVGSLIGEETGAIIVLLALGLAAIIAAIPILGFLSVRTGIRLFEVRSLSGGYQAKVVREETQRLRSRAAYVLVLMFLIYVLASLIPFIGGAVLGRGYYLMAFGAISIFLGALFAQSQVAQSAATTDRKSERDNWESKQPKSLPSALLQTPELTTEEERQVLKLLAQDLSNSEIAEELNSERTQINLLVVSLLEKFKVQDRAELVKQARQKGILPPEM